MTKQEFIKRWKPSHMVITDLEAVIANEISKAQEAQPQEQPALYPIAEAYERGEKVRRKKWEKHEWFKKHTDTHIIDNNRNVFAKPMWDINSMKDKPQDWEIYTEPAEQPSSQAKLDNSFDKERFERMFCAVVASGEYKGKEFDKTAESLAQLDAYYASKEKGGNNA